MDGNSIMEWIDGSLGGVKYRAPCGDKKEK